MRRNVLNITASDVKDAKLTATVTIPAADVDAAIKKAYKDTAKKYRFPGFRAGKAPRPVIDSALGAEATLAQATNDLIAANEPAVLNEPAHRQLYELQVAHAPGYRQHPRGL